MVYGLNRRIPGFPQANKLFGVLCRNRLPQAATLMAGLFLSDRPMPAEVDAYLTNTKSFVDTVIANKGNVPAAISAASVNGE